MLDARIKTLDGKGVRFETYLTTKNVQNEIVKFARKERCKDWDNKDEGRYALFVRAGRKPVELITQTNDEPTELYLTIVGWDDTLMCRGDNDPYTKFKMYRTSEYY